MNHIKQTQYFVNMRCEKWRTKRLSKVQFFQLSSWPFKSSTPGNSHMMQGYQKKDVTSGIMSE